MRKIFFLLIVLAFSKLYSQSANDKKVYLDSLWNETTESNSKYYRIIKDYYLPKDKYIVLDYFKSGKLQMEGSYFEKEVLSKTGQFVYYYENGNKQYIYNYEKSVSLGIFKSWYQNGKPEFEGEYFKNEIYPNLTGDFKIYQYWDSQNKQLVKDGMGNCAFSNKYESESGSILNGNKDGIWKGKNISMKFSFTEKYENGIFISGESIDSLNTTHKYDKLVIQPHPKKGLKHFYTYVAKKFKMPKEAESKNINGKLVLNFIVERDGSISEIIVLKSLGYGIDEEGIRVLQKYSDWETGEYKGLQTRTSFNIPISIVTNN